MKLEEIDAVRIKPFQTLVHRLFYGLERDLHFRRLEDTPLGRGVHHCRILQSTTEFALISVRTSENI